MAIIKNKHYLIDSYRDLLLSFILFLSMFRTALDMGNLSNIGRIEDNTAIFILMCENIFLLCFAFLSVVPQNKVNMKYTAVTIMIIFSVHFSFFPLIHHISLFYMTTELWIFMAVLIIYHHSKKPSHLIVPYLILILGTLIFLLDMLIFATMLDIVYIIVFGFILLFFSLLPELLLKDKNILLKLGKVKDLLYQWKNR